MLADLLRDRLNRALTSTRGDDLAAVRVSRDLARRLNATFGDPICAGDEAARRRAAKARLDDLRAGKIAASNAPSTVAAPVLVYFEKGRNERELTRIREALDAKAIAYETLDVAGDETTIAFVTNKAKCAPDDLPVVFVADRAVGGYAALVEADVSGELARMLTGEPEGRGRA